MNVKVPKIKSVLVLLFFVLLVIFFGYLYFYPPPIKDDCQNIIGAAEYGTLSNVKWHLNQDEDVNMRSIFESGTALHAAALRGHYRITKFLLDNGADVNAKDNDGNTALQLARYNLTIGKLLLSRGANVNQKDYFGQTPLWWAVESFCLDYTKLLVDHGADISVEDLHGMTVLHEAAASLISNQQTPKALRKMVKFLINHGLDINVKDKSGYTPLHYASMSDNDKIAACLIECGADINARTNNFSQWTALRIAIDNKSNKTAILLRQLGGKE